MKYFYILIAFAFAIISLFGCGAKKDAENEHEIDNTFVNDDQEDDIYEDEGYMDEEDSLIPIDLWEDVDVTYKGWAGFGEIDTITFSADSEYSELVDKYIRFVPEEEYHTLKDDDKIRIKAEYDEAGLKKEGYAIEEPSADIIVFGVPHIISSTLYHDGLAWAYVGTRGTEQWMAIDSKGKANVTLDLKSFPVTQFNKGICIIDNKRVINKKGETIWSADEQGMAYATQKWGADHIKNVSIINNGHNYVNMGEAFDYIEEDFFGYPQVLFEVDTFDYTGTYTGVLDEKGNWYLEPTELKGSFWDGNEGVYRASRYYEDPYSITGSEGYYNILKNSFIWRADMSSEEYDDKLAKWRREVWKEKHNGLFYDMLSGSDELFVQTDAFEPGFYDLSGKQVIDMTKYPDVIVSPFPTFYDGYCIVKIDNEQRSSYYTVLDTSGNELFEPRKIEDKLAEKVSDGMFWAETSESGIIYYKTDGEQAFEIPFKIKNGTDFCEGLALLEAEDGVIYVIDASGKILF